MNHHEYSRLFPMLNDECLQQLADDIRVNGLREPIVIDDNDLILDGRNREAACVIAGVEPVYEPFVGNDEAKLAFIVSANIHRRHLTTSQRANVAAKLLPIYEAQAAKRQKSGKNQHTKSHKENLPEGSSGQSRDKAGEAMGVSGKAVDMAAKVIAKAVPEIVCAVDRGELAVSAAAVVADMSHDRQREIVSSGGAKAVKEAAARARKVESKRPERSPYVSECQDDEGPPDIAGLFVNVMEEFRVSLIEIPAKYRRTVMLQVYEQLSSEEVESWIVPMPLDSVIVESVPDRIKRLLSEAVE
jgi:ParB-like chromosome segregation protein Spo0J